MHGAAVAPTPRGSPSDGETEVRHQDGRDDEVRDAHDDRDDHARGLVLDVVQRPGDDRTDEDHPQPHQEPHAHSGESRPGRQVHRPVARDHRQKDEDDDDRADDGQRDDGVPVPEYTGLASSLAHESLQAIYPAA